MSENCKERFSPVNIFTKLSVTKQNIQTFSVPNFKDVERKFKNVIIKCDLAPYAKYKLHFIYFQETADCLKVVCGDLLYGIGQTGPVKCV